MRLILALIVLFVLHHHLVVSRPYMGPNYSPHMWSNIRQRSTVPTVYKTIPGSRFRVAPKHRFNFNTRIYSLEDQQDTTNDIVKQTEAFLNNRPSYDFFPKAPKQNHKSNSFGKISRYFEKVPNSRSTTTPQPPIISLEDEEFLLKHLEDGFNIHRDFEKLLYPRGDDGFRRKREVKTDQQKFKINL